MGLFNRFKTVVKSNVNHFLDQVEDPEKLLEQAILDMQDKKKEAKQLLQQSLAKLKQSGENLEILDSLKNNITLLENRIEQAIKKRDALKKRILKSKILSNKNSNNNNLDDSSHNKDHLGETESFETFDRMEEKIEDLEHMNTAHSELVEIFNPEEESKAANNVKLEALELDKKLDNNLAELKTKMADLNSTESSIEDELNRLKDKK